MSLASFLARRSLHYGWLVAGLTFLALLVAAGIRSAPGVLIVPLEQEFILSGVLCLIAAIFVLRIGETPGKTDARLAVSRS